MDSRLRSYADAIERLRWAAMLLDADDRVAWVSDEFKHFLRETDDGALGVGEHVALAMLKEPYLAAVTLESLLEIVTTALPYVVHSLPGGKDVLGPGLPPGFEELVATIEPQPSPEFWNGRFDYVQPGLPTYEVRFLVSVIRDEAGNPIGQSLLTTIGLPASLVTMLSTGDSAMYERMVRLVEPGRHPAAILFADVQSSGELSRRLPTSSYFQLVRALTSEFDRLVGAHCGVVGKHAGDGMTAFFLSDDAGSPSGAAASALRAARELQRNAVAIAAEVVADVPVVVNAGVHWGAGLYMGQLVPGGRLEVTALGDEVNEAARLQESARDGALLASKAIVELLEPAVAAELGIPQHLLYRPLGELPEAAPKAVRDAGHVAVAAL